MTYQEVQEQRPGPYVIYFHPDKKNGYGVYRKGREGDRLEEQGFADGLGMIIEEHTCIKKASERERDLQRMNGYPVDTMPYWRMMVNQILVSTDKKIRKRRGKTLSKNQKGKPLSWTLTEEGRKAVGKKTSERQKGKQPKHFKAYNQSTKKRVACYSDGLLVKEFDSVTEAGKWTGQKAGLANVSGVLTGRQKTSAGYNWKYID